jgi:hypothetical protein
MRKHGRVLKTLGVFEAVLIESLFHNRLVRRRIADTPIGIILSELTLFLEAQGHVLTSLHAFVHVAEHFSL